MSLVILGYRPSAVAPRLQPTGEANGRTNGMQYVYMLRSLKDTNLYIGCTSNIEKRILQHSQGKVRSTKGRLPVELVYKEAYADAYEAFRKERFYKTPKGKKELRRNWGIVPRP